MGNVKYPITTDEALMGKSTEKIIQLKRKPHDIQPYIDFEKGWKFAEDDKDFLIAYYEDYV